MHFFFILFAACLNFVAHIFFVCSVQIFYLRPPFVLAAFLVLFCASYFVYSGSLFYIASNFVCFGAPSRPP